MRKRTTVCVGKIDIAGLNSPPEKHEYMTAKYFSDRGIDVTFIRPSYIRGHKNADFEMLGKIWETKSLTTDNLNTIRRRLNQATKQSENVIIDLRRISIDYEKKFIDAISKQSKTASLKTLLIITKSGELLTVKGKFDNI